MVINHKEETLCSKTRSTLYTCSDLSFLPVLLSLTQPPTTNSKHSSYTGVIIRLLLVIPCVFLLFSNWHLDCKWVWFPAK